MRLIIGYFILRLQQIFRMTSEVGIFRFLILLAVLVLVITGLVNAALQPDYQSAMVFMYALAILGIHSRRRDKLFIRIHFDYPFSVFFTEYVFLSLPLIAPLIFTNAYFHTIGFLALLSIIVYFNFDRTRQHLNTKLQSLIPAAAFEWKAGIRKSFWLFCIIWSIGLMFSFSDFMAPVSMVLTGLIVFSFYETGEPLDMLMVFELKPAKLIAYKIALHTAILFCCNLPLMLLFWLFHPSIWFIPVVIMLLIIFGHVYLILLKYAFYTPMEKPAGSDLLIAMGFTGMIVPVFMPVVMLLSIRFYFKAINNLKQYLDDFDQ
jgi:hypothetical protein